MITITGKHRTFFSIYVLPSSSNVQVMVDFLCHWINLQCVWYL